VKSLEYEWEESKLADDLAQRFDDLAARAADIRGYL
jgi:hypothetical protein